MSHDNYANLTQVVQGAEESVKPGSNYVHYKNPEKEYVIIVIGLIEATQEPAVVYSDGQITWIRPLIDFLATVVVDDVEVPRFRLIS